MRLLLTLTALLLAACAHATTWDHPTKTETDFHADSARCEAMSRGQGSDGTGGYYKGGDPVTDGYMRGQAIGSGIAARRAQQRIFTSCMQGQGWFTAGSKTPVQICNFGVHAPTDAAFETALLACGAPPPSGGMQYGRPMDYKMPADCLAAAGYPKQCRTEWY